MRRKPKRRHPDDVRKILGRRRLIDRSIHLCERLSLHCPCLQLAYASREMTMWAPMKWRYRQQYEGPRTSLVKRIVNFEEGSQLHPDI